MSWGLQHNPLSPRGIVEWQVVPPELFLKTHSEGAHSTQFILSLANGSCGNMDDARGHSTGAGRPLVPGVAMCLAHLTAEAITTHPPVILRSKNHAHPPLLRGLPSTLKWTALDLEASSQSLSLGAMHVCRLFVGQCSPWREVDRPKASSEIQRPTLGPPGDGSQES